MPEIRAATADDVPAVGRVLAAAFHGDPVWSWLASPRANWDRRASAWFAAEARSQLLGHGTVLIDTDQRGAAVWSPPKRWRASTAEGLRLLVPSARLFRARSLRSIRLITAIEKLHPKPEHWYLAVVGTDPAHQGSGVGSALITTMTDRCDAEGLPAYLESSKESNLAFYARHGFEVRDEVRQPGGPTLWTMWREPKG